MPLQPGDKLGPYQVLSPIGKGGMGEVYRARDLHLKRDVALKVLPAGVASDPERLARFQREAEILASLNHPGIAAIYGITENALVMELVEGETLPCPVPVETAIAYAKQIVDAVEYAHDRGVIHRDLKPANIKVTPEGTIKILDFGLAKALDERAASTENTANSPTLTMGATAAGVILGTAAYMSPEQAVGKTADRRSDIFSFGVVLFELLSGKRAFEGESVGETLAAVAKDAPDWSALPKEIPPYVRKLLERTLTKDRRQRLQAIGEARLILEKGESEVSPNAVPRASKFSWIIAATLGVLALGISLVHFRETPSVEQTLRYSIAAPENSRIHSLAISPNGKLLVIAATTNGKNQMWIRQMDAMEFQPMPSTDDATFPFWSPDSGYVGFFAQGKLKKIAASGGPSQVLCDAPVGRGGSWNRDDAIVFAAEIGRSVKRVSASGGVSTEVASVEGDERHPVFLPDGRRFLYSLRSGGRSGQPGIYVGSLDGKEDRKILADWSGGMLFVPPARGGSSAHILFVRESSLMAVPFDVGTAQVAGDAFPITEGVTPTTTPTYLPAAASENGVLLYVTGGADGGTNQFAWVDRSGKSLGFVSTAGLVSDPALSPDGKRVAFRRYSGSGTDVWLTDLDKGIETRLTSDPANDGAPIWSPAGDRIVFASGRNGGVSSLYEKAANGSGQDHLLLEGGVLYPEHWSRDGRFIIYNLNNSKSKGDVWVLPVDSSAAQRKPIPFLQSEFIELQGQFSPDGHWMAFTSDRSGRREVYVRPFPTGEREYTLSVAGGEMPRWRGDGKELFFESADGKMMAVPVKATVGSNTSFEAGAPVALFDTHMRHSPNDRLFEYDVTPDGTRFLINIAADSKAASMPRIAVVTNWQAGLKK